MLRLGLVAQKCGAALMVLRGLYFAVHPFPTKTQNAEDFLCGVTDETEVSCWLDDTMR